MAEPIVYTMGMNIRQATLSDLPTVIQLGEHLQDESREHEPLLTFDFEQSLKHYTDELANANARIIVAEHNGEIVGYQYSYVTELDYLSQNNRQCTLEALYVLPDYRHQGIGSALMREAEAWAINVCHADRILANIYSGNSASAAIHIADGFVPYCTEYIKVINTSA